MKKISNYINHFAFVLDGSGSMSRLESKVREVFNSEIKTLARRSKDFDQETRVSIYQFGDSVRNLAYDKSVSHLPDISSLYKVQNEGTALIDAVLITIKDLKQTPETYGDHAFLLYILTDGEENNSSGSSLELRRVIDTLPENWTIAVLVPNQHGVFEAKRYGFPANNIQIWDTSEKGIEEVGRVIRTSTDTYMTNRSVGVRGTKNLFNLDASNLNKKVVSKVLDELPAKEYSIFPVHRDSVIKNFVESWTGEDYVVGSAYYQLVKPETIQSRKEICIQNKKNGKVYSGSNARALLGLPNREVRVSPVTYSDFNIFAQSTSVNRKLPRGTQLIVLK